MWNNLHIFVNVGWMVPILLFALLKLWNSIFELVFRFYFSNLVATEENYQVKENHKQNWPCEPNKLTHLKLARRWTLTWSKGLWKHIVHGYFHVWNILTTREYVSSIVLWVLLLYWTLWALTIEELEGSWSPQTDHGAHVHQSLCQQFTQLLSQDHKSLTHVSDSI